MKLRVRTLESERSFKRVAALQSTILQAVVAAALLNVGTLLQLNALRTLSGGVFALSGLFAVKVIGGLLQVKKLDKQEALITGSSS